VCGRLLSVAFLPLMAASTAGLKVGLVTIAVRTGVDGDRLLTLHSSQSMGYVRLGLNWVIRSSGSDRPLPMTSATERC